MNTVTVELMNNRALILLQELEAQHIIRLHQSADIRKNKLSEKYRGVLSKKQGDDLNKHIDQMRNEWNNS